jgi:branched-chain amino acid transport system ATP-binding protein
MLTVSDLAVQYGAVAALHGISFAVNEGEIICLLGSNGAGKTTTIKAILGSAYIVSGKICFKHTEITRWPPHKTVNLGVSVVPEGRRIFPVMTVKENLELGFYIKNDKVEMRNRFDDIFSLFPVLNERKNQLAGTLSGGEQQMLAIGRALMPEPTLLLLDEPSLGLAPIVVQEIYQTIQRINKSETTILLVEQNAKLALEHSNRAYILETGRIVFSGKPEDCLADEKIVSAYLGVRKK